MKIFKNWDKKNFPICEEVFNNIVSIPLFDNLKNEQVEKVITLFKKFFNLK